MIQGKVIQLIRPMQPIVAVPSGLNSKQYRDSWTIETDGVPPVLSFFTSPQTSEFSDILGN
jgi:hypothetical protein